MSQSDPIPPNLRPLRILDYVSAADRAVTPTEIGAALGLAKQTAHRLCGTLVAEGYLARDGQATAVRPGRRLQALAAGALHAPPMAIARHQILRQVATAVREKT